MCLTPVASEAASALWIFFYERSGRFIDRYSPLRARRRRRPTPRTAVGVELSLLGFLRPQHVLGSRRPSLAPRAAAVPSAT